MSSGWAFSLACIHKRAAWSYSSGKKVSPIPTAIKMDWIMPLEYMSVLASVQELNLHRLRSIHRFHSVAPHGTRVPHLQHDEEPQQSPQEPTFHPRLPRPLLTIWCILRKQRESFLTMNLASRKPGPGLNEAPARMSPFADARPHLCMGDGFNSHGSAALNYTFVTGFRISGGHGARRVGVGLRGCLDQAYGTGHVRRLERATHSGQDESDECLKSTEGWGGWT